MNHATECPTHCPGILDPSAPMGGCPIGSARCPFRHPPTEGIPRPVVHAPDLRGIVATTPLGYLIVTGQETVITPRDGPPPYFLAQIVLTLSPGPIPLPADRSPCTPTAP